MITKKEENSSLTIFHRKSNKRNERIIKNYKDKPYKNIIEKGTKINLKNLSHHYFPLINLILFELILIILPKRILLDDPYIELKVNSTGYHQILSDSYSGIKPSAIYVNNEVQVMKDLKIYVESPEHKIRIEWENQLTNFTYMFSNLSSIISVHMNYISSYGCNISYMFYNCNNLKYFTYASDDNNVVKDSIGMFYNCSSLQNFTFNSLYMRCYYSDYDSNNKIYICNYNYYFRNMSYMFYNCQSLQLVTYPNYIMYVNDMRGMFYNCQSLTSFNLNNFKTHYNRYVDLSYMFYNCKKLSSFTLTYKFFVNNMASMFYNCESLVSINLNSFNGTENYHINMSRLFYNCRNLTTVGTNFSKFFISDTREMFFNCTSFNHLYYENGYYYDNIYINIYPYYYNKHVNMSRMFYNCYNLNSIYINRYYTYGKIIANDFNLMFYNCTSLTSVYLNNFYITYVQNMSYMFYNCKRLQYFSRNYIYYDSSLMVKQRTMKGMFQNCESLYSLDLRYNFFTINVEIMWDMFKGCSSLTYLDLYSSNFDTSQVTDMESMFEGCYNLISLNLNKFQTQNVIYMNKMFYNCSSLRSLYFYSISSNSLGTMKQLFYNCSNLQYLNLYSLKEKDQSILEIFDGASTNFKFCIKENEDIPKIFNELLKMDGTTRDCSSDCYNYRRISIPEKKLCCRKYEYNGSCYDDRCPSRTKATCSDSYNVDCNRCNSFNCPNQYYNYAQNDCTSDIKGFYVNDTELNTIDKCHDVCETCSKGPIDDEHPNCDSCKGSRHLYLGQCYDNCTRGSYKDNNNNEICYCFNETCTYCTDEQAKVGLCSGCNNKDLYYKKAYDNPYSFFCYKNLEKHFLKNNQFYRCYYTCLTCGGAGDSLNHLCKVCDSNYGLALLKDEYYNCYPNCSYYFYLNKSRNDAFTCTTSLECPSDYPLLVPEIKQCVQFCKDSVSYKYEYKHKCYNKCPEDTEENEDEKYTCFLSCPFERPFRLVSKDICVSTCTINERRDLECVTNYFGNRTNEEIQNLILSDIEDHLTSNTFNYTNINDEIYIINETKIFYELTSTNIKGPRRTGMSYVNLAGCEPVLRDFYKIYDDGPLYIFKFDIYIEGKEGPTVDYRVYYPLDDKSTLEPLDLTNCEGKAVFISFAINLTGDPDMYNRNSPYYNDLCISYSTNDKVDLTLEDRQNQYIENNKSLCEENCFFVGYDSATKVVECSCEVKYTLPLISEIKIDKNRLYKFMNIKKIANFDVLKCYKLISSKVGIIKNLGFYLFIPTFIMYIVTIFLFHIKEFKLLKKQINDIALAKRYQKYLEDLKKGKIKPKPKPKQKPIKKEYRFVKPVIFNVVQMLNMIPRKKSEIKLEHNNTLEEKKEKDLIEKKSLTEEKVSKTENEKKGVTKEIESEIQKEDLIENNSKEEEINNQSQIKEDKMNAPPIKGGIKITNKKQKRSSEISFSSSKNNLKFNKNKLNLNTNNYNTESFDDLTQKEKERLISIMKHNDNELNALEYKEALKYDNRNYFQYYCSLLRTNHLIVKIISKSDYNSRIIKIFLCFFNFSLSFTVNTLFFNDDTMHKILEDNGEFNFIYQLPQVVYSTIISIIFDSILTFLALSEENVLSVKHEKIIRNVPRKVKDTIKALQVKFVNFFILSFIFFMGFWYYVSCFCAVYKNTQYHLIKDSLISYVTSLITPLGISLFPGLFRIPGIKGKKQFLYLISKIIQLF